MSKADGLPDMKIPSHIVQPLIFGLGLTITLEMLGVMKHLVDIKGAYIFGIMIMYVSYLLYFYMFIKPKLERK